MRDLQDIEELMVEKIEGQRQLIALQGRQKKKNMVVLLPGNQGNLNRDWSTGYNYVLKDYSVASPIFGKAHFRRPYRMSRHLFLRIVQDVENHDEYFKQRSNSIGKLGISGIQKCIAAMKQLAYGFTSDACDEYVRLAETTAMES